MTVVDDDRVGHLACVVEQVRAAPGLNVVARAGDLTSASRSMRSAPAIAAVYIQTEFEHDLKPVQRPQVITFCDQRPSPPPALRRRA